MTVNTIMGSFNEKRFKQLRQLCEAAIKDKKATFTMENHPWDTKFAAYMLEFLSPRLGFGHIDYKTANYGRL